MKTTYRDTLVEIARIQQGPPPVLQMPFAHDTLVTRAWVNDPIHDEVQPMEHHVIAPTLRGSGWSEVRFGSTTIRSPSITGGITIAPRGFSGHFDCDGTPIAANVFLSRQRFHQSAEAMGIGSVPDLIPRLNFEDPKLFKILSLIATEAEGLGAHSRLYLETLLDLLCLQLLREHSPTPIRPAGEISGLRSPQVRRVTDYIYGHLDEPISLQQLADVLHLSRYHFCSAFRRATGFTPHRWLVRLRMERARELLLDSRLPITEIALAVGYQTPSSFTYAFRLAFGTTPTAFRAGISS